METNKPYKWKQKIRHVSIFHWEVFFRQGHKLPLAKLLSDHLEIGFDGAANLTFSPWRTVPCLHGNPGNPVQGGYGPWGVVANPNEKKNKSHQLKDSRKQSSSVLQKFHLKKFLSASPLQVGHAPFWQVVHQPGKDVKIKPPWNIIHPNPSLIARTHQMISNHFGNLWRRAGHILPHLRPSFLRPFPARVSVHYTPLLHTVWAANLERTSSSFAFATGACRVELHQSPTKSVILQNCEAHLIFSLCFGCLWLVLCQIRPEGPSKAVHVAMLLFLFDPFSMGLSSTFSGWKALIPRPAYRVTCGKPWVFDWVSCTLDPVKSPMSLSKSPCLWCCLRC